MLPFPLLHWKSREGVSPSASVAVPVQLSVVVVRTPVFGDMLAATEKTGGVVLTIAEALEVAVAPWLSVMVAWHNMDSFGVEFPAVTARLAPVPRGLPL